MRMWAALFLVALFNACASEFTKGIWSDVHFLVATACWIGCVFTDTSKP